MFELTSIFLKSVFNWFVQNTDGSTLEANLVCCASYLLIVAKTIDLQLKAFYADDLEHPNAVLYVLDPTLGWLFCIIMQWQLEKEYACKDEVKVNQVATLLWALYGQN